MSEPYCLDVIMLGLRSGSCEILNYYLKGKKKRKRLQIERESNVLIYIELFGPLIKRLPCIFVGYFGQAYSDF